MGVKPVVSPVEIRSSTISINPVLIAPSRSKRPSDFKTDETVKTGFCPFCPGNEEYTPDPECFRIDQGGGNGWSLRVVPNKFPALPAEGASKFLIDAASSSTIADAHGAHEVIIETPGHNDDLSTMSPQQIKYLLLAIVSRTQDLYRDSGIRYIQVFKNHGAEAGASLEHPHTQLIGLPEIPDKISTRLHRLDIYRSSNGRSIFETMLERSANDKRIVINSTNFVCFCPYESKFPFEMCIVPLKEHSCLVHSRNDFEKLSEVISEAFKRLARVFNGLPPFNFCLDEAPPSRDCSRFYRWRLRLFPRVTKMAGFELATSFFINPTSPEEAAQILSDASL